MNRLLAYNRKAVTMAMSSTEAAPKAAAPLIVPLASSIAGSYCSVTKAKYRATLKIRANTYK
ncbi:hypothetical protein D1872_298810 [compost metagenome]